MPFKPPPSFLILVFLFASLTFLLSSFACSISINLVLFSLLYSFFSPFLLHIFSLLLKLLHNSLLVFLSFFIPLFFFLTPFSVDHLSSLHFLVSFSTPIPVFFNSPHIFPFPFLPSFSLPCFLIHGPKFWTLLHNKKLSWLSRNFGSSSLISLKDWIFWREESLRVTDQTFGSLNLPITRETVSPSVCLSAGSFSAQVNVCAETLQTCSLSETLAERVWLPLRK